MLKIGSVTSTYELSEWNNMNIVSKRDEAYRLNNEANDDCGKASTTYDSLYPTGNVINEEVVN